MPLRSVDAVFYVGQTPEIEFEDGLFRVAYEIGKKARFEVVMRPAVFAKAMLLAEEARAKFRLNTTTDGNVHQLRGKK